MRSNGECTECFFIFRDLYKKVRSNALSIRLRFRVIRISTLNSYAICFLALLCSVVDARDISTQELSPKSRLSPLKKWKAEETFKASAYV